MVKFQAGWGEIPGRREAGREEGASQFPLIRHLSRAQPVETLLGLNYPLCAALGAMGHNLTPAVCWAVNILWSQGRCSPCKCQPWGRGIEALRTAALSCLVLPRLTLALHVCQNTICRLFNAL